MTSTSPGRPPQGKKLSICCDQTAAKVGPHRDERTPLFECEFEDLRHKPGAFEQDDFRAWWKCVYCGFVNPHPRDDVVVPSHCWCWFDTPIQQELGIVDAPEAEYANTRCHPHGTIEPLSAEYELRSVNWIYVCYHHLAILAKTPRPDHLSRHSTIDDSMISARTSIVRSCSSTGDLSIQRSPVLNRSIQRPRVWTSKPCPTAGTSSRAASTTILRGFLPYSVSIAVPPRRYAVSAGVSSGCISGLTQCVSSTT